MLRRHASTSHVDVACAEGKGAPFGHDRDCQLTLPMLVTESGIVTLERDIHPPKAYCTRRHWHKRRATEMRRADARLLSHMLRRHASTSRVEAACAEGRGAPFGHDRDRQLTLPMLATESPIVTLVRDEQ